MTWYYPLGQTEPILAPPVQAAQQQGWIAKALIVGVGLMAAAAVFGLFKDKPKRANAKKRKPTLRPVSKPGKHGTLYKFRVLYKDRLDPGSPTFDYHTWAYNIEHAEDRFFSSGDPDWEILSVKKVLSDQWRRNSHRRNPIQMRKHGKTSIISHRLRSGEVEDLGTVYKALGSKFWTGRKYGSSSIHDRYRGRFKTRKAAIDWVVYGE